MSAKKSTEDLTSCQRRIWLGICAGKKNREIAVEMNISLSNVEHNRGILARSLRLRPRDTAGFVRMAAAAGVLNDLPPLCFRPEKHIRRIRV